MMAIDGELVKELLRKDLRADYGLAQSLDLALLAEIPASEAVRRGHRLHALLRGMVERELATQRAGLEVAVGQGTPIADAVRLDFAPNDEHLRAWSALYHRYFAGRHQVKALASYIPVTTRWYRNYLRLGYDLLADQITAAERRALGVALAPDLLRRLPPVEYHCGLFGRDDQVRRLMNVLTVPGGPAFVSIEGLGGIGKTALAQEVTARLASDGRLRGPVVWARVAQGVGAYTPDRQAARNLGHVLRAIVDQLELPELHGLAPARVLERLRPVLDARGSLVVVDNLETADDVAHITEKLHGLAGAARFLITSRHTLAGIPYACVEHVPELSMADSRDLVNAELPPMRLPVTDAEIRAIYDAVGGSPLALKLVAAQLTLPLERVLNGLKEARADHANRMFFHIYNRTWCEFLDENARRVLFLLKPVQGAGFEWLLRRSGLTPDDFIDALETIRRYKLLEVTGAVDDPVYRLHRLTVTFLNSLLDYE